MLFGLITFAKLELPVNLSKCNCTEVKEYKLEPKMIEGLNINRFKAFGCILFGVWQNTTKGMKEWPPLFITISGVPIQFCIFTFYYDEDCIQC